MLRIDEKLKKLVSKEEWQKIKYLRPELKEIIADLIKIWKTIDIPTIHETINLIQRKISKWKTRYNCSNCENFYRDYERWGCDAGEVPDDTNLLYANKCEYYSEKI